MHKLKATKKGYKPGRDRLFSLLRKHQLLVPLKKRRYARTTQAGWWRCENRLADFTPAAPDQAYVSDITYLDTEQGFVYLTLITDAFSRYIVGYALSDSLATDASLKALTQALTQRKSPKSGLIHHSDRGVQFTDRRYRQRLTQAGAVCSMGAKGDCYDNAMAERMNGILKQEYGLDAYFRNIQQAEKAVLQSVWLYNHDRPHLSLNYQTPAEVHQTT